VASLFRYDFRRLERRHATGARRDTEQFAPKRSIGGDRTNPLYLEVDKADQRREFLRALELGLSSLDEPFLETVLDDKSIVVRRAAADLLARIPGSALLQRVATQIRECLMVVTKGILRQKAIEVSLLSEVPPALARDGVEKKGAPQGTGEKAWWTLQGIGILPPSVWCERFSMSPDELLKAAAAGDDGDLLTTAWTHAAIRHSDAGWARALLLAANPPENSIKNLFELLAPGDREIVALASQSQTALYVALAGIHGASLSLGLRSRASLGGLFLRCESWADLLPSII